jgi:hypothetical protein
MVTTRIEGRRMVMERKMVKVSVEVKSGTARFRVGVQAPSINKALRLMEGRYPHREVRVMFPIEPEGFFSLTPSAEIVGLEQAHTRAA